LTDGSQRPSSQPNQLQGRARIAIDAPQSAAKCAPNLQGTSAMAAGPTVSLQTHDYSLVGPTSREAMQQRYHSAEWYKSPVPRARLKELMKRSDGPAIRDTLIWILAFLVNGGLAVALYPSWWSVPFFLAYGVLYGSSTDSRWHECGHRTAFRTQWMNDWVYQIACFMIMRNPTGWRWSHTRHHTDTIIVGLDPEIAVMRPAVIARVIGMFFAIPQVIAGIKRLFTNASGRLDPEEAVFIPHSEARKVILVARIWLVIHSAVIAAGIAWQSWLPMLLIGPLPTMYGAWLHVITGLTQHAGLAENVLDHRLNCRTVYMNPVVRFIYWNMNYHVEHHMFPMVPYHALPELHKETKDDTPPPYPNLWAAYKEIIPAVLRQVREPGYSVSRPLPPRKPMPAAAE
jgi:fatty acid desaturase